MTQAPRYAAHSLLRVFTHFGETHGVGNVNEKLRNVPGSMTNLSIVSVIV